MMLLNQGMIVRVPRCDKSKGLLDSILRHMCDVDRMKYAMTMGVVIIGRQWMLTCKSCFAASAPARVLNVTKPTGC